MDGPPLPVLPGYADLELIAHGSSALVFRATRHPAGPPVAIKVILAAAQADPVGPARELATAALSGLPHIVSIIDAGVTGDGRPYFVMDYYEDGSYEQILRRCGPLPIDEVLEVATAVGGALEAAHRLGVIHRDVQPSNILRSRSGPVLADFGITRPPDELANTVTREVMTLYHASPEALLRQAQSATSDVYSLASTMWTLLVGHAPFADPTRPARDIYAFRDRVLNEALPALPRADVPSWLAAELSRALSKLPAHRHASAAEFVESLRPRSTGERVRAAAATAATPVPSTAATPVPSTAAAPAVGDAPGGTLDDLDGHPDGTLDDPDGHPDGIADGDPDGDLDGGWATGAGLARTGSGLALVDLPDRAAPGRRPSRVVLLALAGTVVLGAGAFGLRAGLADVASEGGVPPSDAGGHTRFVTPVSDGAPGDVRLTDQATSITLSWRDPSGGSVPFGVVIRRGDGSYLDPIQVPRQQTRVTVSGLDPAASYCFVVVAIYSVSHSAAAAPQCTEPRRATSP